MGVLGFYIPFEEWPEEVKANYGYDPERAERLLDEAGYPRGADGIRFKTTLLIDDNRGDVEYTQVAKDYWAQIGVDVEMSLTDVPTLSAHWNHHTYEGYGPRRKGHRLLPPSIRTNSGLLERKLEHVWGPGP